MLPMSDHDSAPDSQADDDFRDALRAALERTTGRPARCVETHVSWVLLDGEHAWKLKKPIRLPFLDFSSPQVREQVCRDELRLNRRLAPGLYLDVVPICGSRHEPRFGASGDAEGPVVDHAVMMREFPPDALLGTRLAAGRLAVDEIDRLARRIADFHDEAEPAPAGYGSADHVATETRKVLDTLASLFPEGARRADGQSWQATIGRLRQWCDARAAALAPVFDARRAGGRVRDCHGDLHLANTVVLTDMVTAFDCVEFAPALRMTDVLADVAFLAMDLIAHERPDLAMRFVDRWLEHSGDHDGLPVLRYYLVYRALVRAMVAALRDSQAADTAGSNGSCTDREPDYLAVALRLIEPDPPRLAITHGLSASGKSRQAAQFVERCGAIRLRSDVIRKRMFGLSADARSADQVAGGIYDPTTTTRTYERMLTLAGSALDDGWPVIVDATFLRAAQRRPFLELARARGLSFTIIDCQAPFDTLARRIAARAREGIDPSEADLSVLERQRDQDEAFGADEAPFVETAGGEDGVSEETR